jgi:hypothetical protein
LIYVNAGDGEAREGGFLEEGHAMSTWNIIFLVIVAIGFLGFMVAVGGLQLRLRSSFGARRDQIPALTPRTAAREARKARIIEHQQS